jgi:hypothetical protein
MYVSSLYMCVLMLLYMFVLTICASAYYCIYASSLYMCVSSYYCIYVSPCVWETPGLASTDMCPQAYVLLCPHTTLYVCPHTTICTRPQVSVGDVWTIALPCIVCSCTPFTRLLHASMLLHVSYTPFTRLLHASGVSGRLMDQHPLMRPYTTLHVCPHTTIYML